MAIVKPKVGVISYGSGNIASVQNALSKLDCDVLVTGDHKALSTCSHLILPGVGSFNSVKAKLDLVLDPGILLELSAKARGLLGICVGLQILADQGEEFGLTPGFGKFKGTVTRIDSAPLLPHMGWNNLIEIRDACPILASVTPEDDFYFVHSYALSNWSDSQIMAKAHYGSDFPAVVREGNIYGVQFHPEKSSASGQKIFRNFLSL